MNILRWQKPKLTTWQTSGRLPNVLHEIDRLFEEPLSELALSSQVFSGWTPRLDMHEDENNVVVTAELPGMKKEDINLSLHNDCLSISGERRNEWENRQAEVYRAERFTGRFQRTVALPTPVAADKVKALCKDGVLTITLPKAEEAKPKKIDVKVN
jgi:HSP20 family protein